MRRALSAKTGPIEAELSEEHLLAFVTTIAFGALEQPSAERRAYMAHEVERLRNTSSAYTTAEGQAFAAAVGSWAPVAVRILERSGGRIGRA
jgi:hypothetical protein